MPRPKCTRVISDRLPIELIRDVEVAAGRLGISGSEYRKQCIERCLRLAWVFQADWYTLRELDPETLRKRCPTLSGTELN